MNNQISLKSAKKVFLDVFPIKGKKITNIKLNVAGHTNISYCVTYGGVKYQMKFTRPKALPNLKAKIRFSEIMGWEPYIYVDIKSGITIRKWIRGRCKISWGIRSIKILNLVFKDLKKIHALPKKYFRYFKKFNLKRYISSLHNLEPKYANKYLELVNKYKNDPICISKIDNYTSNILVAKNDKIYHIDNEWVGLACEYWDFAETIRWILDFNWRKIDYSKYIKNFNMQKLKNYIFMSCVYNYLWAFNMDPDPRNAYYRRYLKKTIITTYKFVK